MKYRRSLPSLASLIAFEAAARHLSFTEAAGELNVTQAAVSHQIATLEAELGATLFLRKHQKVELTTQGQMLSQNLSSALQMMVRAVREIKAPSEPPSLVVSTTAAFSHFWLTPRLQDFREKHPDIQISILAHSWPVNYDDVEADAVMFYGEPQSSNSRVTVLHEDTVRPVASPDYLEKKGSIESFDCLDRHILIEQLSPNPKWENWHDYLSTWGKEEFSSRVEVKCKSYLDVVYAAVAGHGIALGWMSMVQPMIDNGQLVELSLEALPSTCHFQIAKSRSPSSPGALDTFVSWLKDQY